MSTGCYFLSAFMTLLASVAASIRFHHSATLRFPASFSRAFIASCEASCYLLNVACVLIAVVTDVVAIVIDVVYDIDRQTNFPRMSVLWPSSECYI